MTQSNVFRMSVFRSIFAKGLMKERVAIVTGGGTGIGRAVALELASLGCRVVIASRDVDKLQLAAREMNESLRQRAGHDSGGISGEVVAVPCNIKHREATDHLVAQTADRFGGRLDYLVNNAGGQFQGFAEAITEKGWRAVMDTNFFGTINCTLSSFEHWKKTKKTMGSGAPAIVNILMANERGFATMSHSGASRAAVENAATTMALEWASHGVRLNAVRPGVIYSSTAAANYAPRDVFAEAARAVPCRRTGTVEELAAGVTFLLSPAATFITGIVLRVDGGAELSSPYWSDDMIALREKANGYESLKLFGFEPPYGDSPYCDADRGVIDSTK